MPDILKTALIGSTLLAASFATLPAQAQRGQHAQEFGRIIYDQVRGERGFKRQNRARVQVTSPNRPRLAAEVEDNLRRILRNRYGNIGPIYVNLSRLDVDTRLKSRRNYPVRKPLAGVGFHHKTNFTHNRRHNCDVPLALHYNQVSGSVRAKYRLRYEVSGRAIGQNFERAKGKVRAPYVAVQNARVRTACGWEEAPRRLLKAHGLNAGRSAHRPAQHVRAPLARDIAQEIARDINKRLRRQY